MKYKLVSIEDENDQEDLNSEFFEDCLTEALELLEWYIIDEGEFFVGVSDTDASDTIELEEPSYEDAQYELLEQLGFFISEEEEEEEEDELS